jgi:hypothetical protein
LLEERWPTEDQREQHRRQGVHVHARIAGGTAEQLRCGVHHDVVLVAGTGAFGGIEVEVADQWLTERAEEHVLRLQLAVHEAGAVGRFERTGDLHPDPNGFVPRQRLPALEHVGERAVLQPLTDHERPLATHAGVEVGDDVRVAAELTHQRALTFEARDRRVAGTVRGVQLDGHSAAERHLHGLVQLGVVAATNQALLADSVDAKFCGIVCHQDVTFRESPST